MKSYCSFLVINPSISEVIESLSFPEDWNLDLCSDPSERFWFSKNVSTEISSPRWLGSQMKTDTPGQLILVNSDETTANNVIQLLCASYDVLEGNPSNRIGLRLAFEFPESPAEQESLSRNVFQTTGYFEQFVHRPGILAAVHIAARIWSEKSTIYAIHKLSRSYSMESISWHSTAPEYGQIFEKNSKLYAEQVNISDSINLAFSAIEELQLQVKSSESNKRFLNGKWNPKVLEDISRRLEASGVDPDQRINWIIRGDESIMDVKIEPKLGVPAAKQDNKVVRDLELTLPEALHFCSYIRNFMTAHRLNENSTALGPYEVHNIQSVARRLILSKCRLWDIGVDDLIQNNS